MKKLRLSLFFLVVAMSANAQLTLDMQLNFQPDPDPREWLNQAGLLLLTTMNPTGETYQYKFKSRLTLNGSLVMDNNLSMMPVETIGPFDTEIREAQDIFPPSAINVVGDIKTTFIRTGQFPAGNYLVCTQLVNLQNQPLSLEACRPVLISDYQQPSLIFPTDGMVLPTDALPTFSWTPVVPPPPFPVTYRLRLVELSDLSAENSASTAKNEDGYEVPYSQIEAQGWSHAGVPFGGIWVRHKGKGKPTPIQRDVLNANWSCFENEQGAVNPSNAAEPIQVENTGWKSSKKPRFQPTKPKSSQAAVGTVQAFRYNYPLIDFEQPGQTMATWPVDIQSPEAGKRYAWSVQALRDDGRPVGANEGTAIPFVFGVQNFSQEMEVEDEMDFPIPEFIILLDGCFQHLYADGSWLAGECPNPMTDEAVVAKQLQIRHDGGIYVGEENGPVQKLPLQLAPSDAPKNETAANSASEVLPMAIAEEVSQSVDPYKGYEELSEAYTVLFEIQGNTYALRSDGTWGQLKTPMPLSKIVRKSKCHFTNNLGSYIVENCSECEKEYPNLKLSSCKDAYYFVPKELPKAAKETTVLSMEKKPAVKIGNKEAAAPVETLQLYNQNGRIKYKQESGRYLDVTTLYDSGSLTSTQPKEITVCRDAAGNWVAVKNLCHECPNGNESCLKFKIGVNQIKMLPKE